MIGPGSGSEQQAASDGQGPDASGAAPASEPVLLAEEPETVGVYLLAGGAVAVLLLSYLGAYVIQAANLARYREGFVLAQCPVCERGELTVEDRRYRTLGLPRVRRVVRCDECRSVLRQVGRGRWRYAVDAAENPDLFDVYNGQVVSEHDLLTMATPFQGPPPEYIEGDEP